jgi:hypothetical protein
MSRTDAAIGSAIANVAVIEQIAVRQPDRAVKAVDQTGADLVNAHEPVHLPLPAAVVAAKLDAAPYGKLVVVENLVDARCGRGVISPRRDFPPEPLLAVLIGHKNQAIQVHHNALVGDRWGSSMLSRVGG